MIFNRRNMLGSCIATLCAPFIKMAHTRDLFSQSVENLGGFRQLSKQAYHIRIITAQKPFDSIIIPCSKIVNIQDDIYRLYFEIEPIEPLCIPIDSKIHFYRFDKYAFTLLMYHQFGCIKGDKLVLDFRTPIENLT